MDPYPSPSLSLPYHIHTCASTNTAVNGSLTQAAPTAAAAAAAAAARVAAAASAPSAAASLSVTSGLPKEPYITCKRAYITITCKRALHNILKEPYITCKGALYHL